MEICALLIRYEELEEMELVWWKGKRNDRECGNFADMVVWLLKENGIIININL